MSKNVAFSSPEIAKKIQKGFGKRAESVRIKMQHDKEISEFLTLIDTAHKNTSKSKLKFK